MHDESIVSYVQAALWKHRCEYSSALYKCGVLLQYAVFRFRRNCQKTERRITVVQRSTRRNAGRQTRYIMPLLAGMIIPKLAYMPRKTHKMSKGDAQMSHPQQGHRTAAFAGIDAAAYPPGNGGISVGKETCAGAFARRILRRGKGHGRRVCFPGQHQKKFLLTCTGSLRP